MLLVEALPFGDACVPEDEVDTPLFPEDGLEGLCLGVVRCHVDFVEGGARDGVEGCVCGGVVAVEEVEGPAPGGIQAFGCFKADA